MTAGLIDWRLVGFSALWILGLSVLLATLSFADYAAHAERSRLRAVLERRSYQTAIYAGLALFASGLSGTAAAWWEIALWIVLTLAFVVLAWRTWKEAGIRG